jgi:hypothetical protein
MPAPGSAASPSFGTRLTHAGLFVAIVWAVAGSFVAFELVSLRGMDFALAHPAIFRNLLLSRATQASTACDPGSAAAGGTNRRAAARADVRAGSWTLGMRVGRDAQARMATTVTPDVLGASAQGIRQLAGALGVAEPRRFLAREVLNANIEFVSFIEADADGTAHGLAVNYSPDACRLYKLGAFWGYAALVRTGVPGERNVYTVEINYYAKELDLPRALWQPFIERTPRNATAQDINAQNMDLTARLTSHLFNPGK